MDEHIAILTQSQNWREIGELGITDALRNSQASYGDASYEVRLEKLKSVLRGPLKDWKEVLKPKHQPLRNWLVLEPS
ncbi:hypothetical protein Lal_00047659 [Lupinus albus]|nr:hypothetical protein Lal_00047659 [Lupinus albus]